jgi:cellulose synthase/poly-beta-1,6-N-acetylglucosamine synthase-like glycosyltransferase
VGVERLLGTALVEDGHLTLDQLAWAVDLKERTGSRLGSILVASGLVKRKVLYETLAANWSLPFVDVTAEPLDPGLLAGLDGQRLAADGWLPLRRLDGGQVLVATSEPLTPDRRWRIETTLQESVEFAATTDWDITQGVRRAFQPSLTEEATLGLWRRSEGRSARRVLSHDQIVVGVLALLVVAGAFAVAPRFSLVTASAVASLVFLAAVLFKFVVSMSGARRERDQGITDEEVLAVRDDELPTFTILVPLYKEAGVVPDLVGNLAALDYPAEKLEILLLLEADDAETIAAVRAARPPETTTIMVVPDGTPKTKPKACNVGLFFARGEHLVIYDAEDRPDPDQLKKAALAFRRAGPDLVCVQAALNYWNDDENALTRMFTLEYSYWFDYMLPGLDALHLPIPLGGTSNHFRTDALRRLGGWDPYNVTEDADLGIRASALGYRVGVVNSTTFEEANCRTRNWIRQRSRWIKGYMQTFLVHLRHPVALVRTAGFRETLAFALLIGGTPLTFLLAPPLFALFLASLLFPGAGVASLFPSWVLEVSLFNLLIGNGLMVYLSMMGAFKRRRYSLVPWALLNPVYWTLHSIAAYKAAWQLIRKPHHWEKTEHGISSHRPDQAGIAVEAPVMAA